MVVFGRDVKLFFTELCKNTNAQHSLHCYIGLGNQCLGNGYAICFWSNLGCAILVFHFLKTLKKKKKTHSISLIRNLIFFFLYFSREILNHRGLYYFAVSQSKKCFKNRFLVCIGIGPNSGVTIKSYLHSYYFSSHTSHNSN